MRRARGIVSNMDLFSEEFKLNYKGATQENTLCGGIFSLIVYALMIFYGLQKAILFVNQSNPEVS